MDRPLSVDVRPPTFPEESCAELGDMATRSCYSRNASDLTCDYKDGDGGRSVTVHYKCSPAEMPPTTLQPDPATSHYVVTFANPSVCAGYKPHGACDFSGECGIYADMHDGDMKKWCVTAGGMLTIGPYNNTQKWAVTTPWDRRHCNASVNFNVPGKPGPPPVPLSVTYFTGIGGAAQAPLEEVVFTDPSGTLAKPLPSGSARPLNAWIRIDTVPID